MFKHSSLAWFLSAFAVSLFALIVERLLGIGWDFHVDSVTYATTSKSVVDTLVSDNIFRLFNAGYYVWVSFLAESIPIVILFNAFIFALTTVLLVYLIKESNRLLNRPFKKTILFYFLVFNPYRVHLSTTMLKDTMVLFLSLLLIFFISNRNFFNGVLALITLAFVRLASPIYLISFFDRRRLFLFVLLILPLLFLPAIQALIFSRLDESNTVVLTARSYDLVPSWQSLGYVGSLLRAII